MWSTLHPFCLLLSFYVLPFIFTLSIHLLYNSPSVLSRSVPDDSLRSFAVKMCLFPSFVFKDVACVRQRPGNMLLSPCDCFSQRWGWSKRQRSAEATSHDATGCISVSEVTYPSKRTCLSHIMSSCLSVPSFLTVFSLFIPSWCQVAQWLLLDSSSVVAYIYPCLNLLYCTFALWSSA